MPIQLYVSNSLPQLARQLSKDLPLCPSGVFGKQQIVTQTEGMNNWLTLAIAKQLGIAANFSFNKPNDIIAQIYYLLGGKNKPLLSADFVKWTIFQLLSDNLFTLKFPLIAGYYRDNDVKKIALATKVADLFDQYQLYRPETITTWNKTSLTDITDNWQQYLWVSIYMQVNGSMLDKTGMIAHIIAALQKNENQQILINKIPQLHFFGIAVITPFYLQLFNEFSKHIPIRFYLLNPAPTSFWLEDKSEKQIARINQFTKRKADAAQYSNAGNNLLNSWGNIVKDSFSLLFQDETYINLYNDTLAQEPTLPNSLLQKIQHDIYFNSAEGSRNLIEVADFKDGSLTINACFTPVREVEVLYNFLTQLVDQQKQKISPRDIVVMVSDIDNYAPYIRAIFDNAPYEFPYTIADESIVVGNNLFNAIGQLLSLQADSFKAEEILELLESKYIRARFSLSDIPSIRKAVNNAKIRFGISGEAENETKSVSWENGLKRIMSGLCISGEPMMEWGNDLLIPLDTTEGADSLELIRFWHFIQILQYFVEQRNEPKSIANWGAYLQDLLENMVFQAGEKEDADYHRFILYLEKLTLLDTVTDTPISFEVFRHSFLEIIGQATKKQAFASAGITFCSLIPMRSIPFKVVAMLGMDFDKFPRKETTLSFNLLKKQKQKGDRNVKDNDKHLFLETILSAENNFYLSYIGKSSKDAANIPPSSLVDELVAYIISGTNGGNESMRNEIIITHPLHGFSQQYFNGSGLVSYLSDDKYKNNMVLTANPKEAQVYAFQEILITDVLQFFKDPIKWYFNKGLSIYYREEDVLLADTEIFKLDDLEKWSIKNELIHLEETEYENFYQRTSILGNLPLKNMGRLSLNKVIDQIRPMKKRLSAVVLGATATSYGIHLTLGQSIITGKINNLYGDKIVATSDSGNYNKYALEAFLTYLLATAQGLEVDFYFIPFKYINNFCIPRGTITQQDAINRLTPFIEQFKNGFEQPFLFFPTFKASPYQLFKGTAATYRAAIEKMRWDERDYTFTDNYLIKAYENHFFKEGNFDVIKANTMNIFEPINNLMPGIIKK